ncbi:retrovirus-related Pol polyprotein from transposon opus [Nephila pilipes]|uniref:Retrovirus-related Pol polyprotein from transposon opus n=1 Tax=Nephila pilipes TaxID=299642 RepID=A0A8X6UBZ4_NEPPI|nr:retrovirus-related Pol polyprotein from transposon opus [Nephila pilipes]
MEAVPSPDITAEIVGKAIYEHWICRFGVPATIITDQGLQFESQLFRSIAAICGAKVGHTTPYHPQCNGKVEGLHRTLKGAIKAHNNIKWTESTVLLGLRAALRPDVNHTIPQMVYDVDKGEDSGIGVEKKSDSESFKERSCSMLHWLLELLELTLEASESEILQREWGRIVKGSKDAVRTAIELEKMTLV